jgi:uncharacterized protein (DUF362 family)
MTHFFDTSVGIIDCGNAAYPAAPFNPPEIYPEYPFKEGLCQKDNFVYEAVRNLFFNLGMDRENYGKPEWNPLGEIIRPGDKVVLKPNLVISEHELGLPGIEASTVHGSVIRPFVDYTCIALKGEGRISIGDSPIKEVDFPKIMGIIGVDAIMDFYATRRDVVPVEVVDYRDLRAYRREDGTIVGTSPLEGDQRGYTVVDLKKESMFDEIAHLHGRFRSTAAVYENVIEEAHTSESHKYSFANTVLEADVFICLAKLKTHRKAGVTLSLKNLVGLTNEKRWLPHHRVGTLGEGGDMLPDDAPLSNRVADRVYEYFKATRLGMLGFKYVLPILRAVYRFGVGQMLSKMEKKEHLPWAEGDWYRNDTVWRMVLDLNQILLFSDKEGKLHDTPQRRYFSCIDGILAGDREGPLHPTPKPVGILVGGYNPAAVDLACIRLMDFDYRKIPLMKGIDRMARSINACATIDETWERLKVFTNRDDFTRLHEQDASYFGFEPSQGWKGHIEMGHNLSGDGPE